ncbi:hypothetical protein [Yinghuangia seranimata]|uniref:hypothetical protein n=1 Tax=Yinghuangia seranimata TaxID=408067 RepID=UPI00248D1915|nr:hypothetical protein [Yinghuangia seranimata]MDI2128326.1 hypothetical protein [Yinghuangia seranimata]
MDRNSLDELLNQPGEYIGARRVRRLGVVAPGALALEWWNGTAWVCGGYATDNHGVKAWLEVTPDGSHPWKRGTGRRRKRPQDTPTT